MNKNNQHLEIWDKIELYLSDKLPEPERRAFEELIRQNEEVAEMLAFAETDKIKELCKDMEPAEGQEARREIIEERLSESSRLAQTLAFEQKLRLLTRRERLLKLLDTPSQNPAPDPSDSSGPSILEDFGRRPILYIIAAFLIMAGGVFIFQSLAYDKTSFSDVPDYAYQFTKDEIGEKQAYEQGNYEQARNRFEELRWDLMNSEFKDQEMIDIYNFYIAICDLRLGNWQEARQRLERVAGSDLDLIGHPEELFLGLVYYHQGEYADAREWLEKAANSEGNLTDGTPIATVAKRYLSKIPGS